LSGLAVYLFFGICSGSSLGNGFLHLICKNLQLKNVYTSWLAGTDNINVSISEIMKSLVYYSYVLAVLFFGVFLISKSKFIRNNYSRKALYVLIYFIIITSLFVILASLFSYQLQYRPIFFLVLLALIISVFKIIKKVDVSKNVFLLGFCLFSLLLMARMVLFARAGHYGFYILVPSIIVYYTLFSELIPRFIKGKQGGYLYNTGFILVSIVFIFFHFNITKFCYKHRSLTFSSKRGSIYLFDNEREHRCIDLINYIQNNTNPDETLVVFPEGIAINFFAERENPLYYYSYHPVGLIKEESVIKGMLEKQVDFIALVQRRTDEYGFPVFGRDYAQGLMEYLNENYEMCKQFGFFPFTTECYGIALFQRKAKVR
ncbi:MAG: hypothetical protein ABIB11_03115, partial [Candidatus Omnitrophota bacterium]